MPCLEDSLAVQFILGLLDQRNYMTIPSFSWRSPSSQMAYWFHPVDLGHMFLVAITVLILGPSQYPCFLTCNPALAKWMLVSRWAASQGWGKHWQFLPVPLLLCHYHENRPGQDYGRINHVGSFVNSAEPILDQQVSRQPQRAT